MHRENLLHHLLAGFRQVLLVGAKFSCRALAWVHLTVLRRGIKAIDKVSCSSSKGAEFRGKKQLLWSRLKDPTKGVDEVLLANQLHVIIYGFGGQGVLSEDQCLLLSQTLHLSTSQVQQELLEQIRYLPAEVESVMALL